MTLPAWDKARVPIRLEEGIYVNIQATAKIENTSICELVNKILKDYLYPDLRLKRCMKCAHGVIMCKYSPNGKCVYDRKQRGPSS